MTLFEKIISREVPASIVHEDEDLIAFHDIDPKAPVHVLIVPKRLVRSIGMAAASDAHLIGKLLFASQHIAIQLGVHGSGYRLVVNHGADAGESVPHLHVHLLGGRSLGWPPG